MEGQIQFEPGRRKATEKSSYGRERPSFGIGLPGEKMSRQMTVSELAGWKLNQELEKYPGFTKKARENLQSEFTNMENIRTMNMKLLATALNFLQDHNNNPTPDSFNTSESYLSQLLPSNGDPIEKQRILISYKAELLMYIRAILRFRQQ